MNVNSEDRAKVKGYTVEKKVLEEFLTGNLDNVSVHVINAVKNRIGIVDRELRWLSANEHVGRRALCRQNKREA